MDPFGVVFFDCDSTLSRIEGIDELARETGIGTEMAALTRRAMDGELPLEQVYGRRLEAIRPTRSAVERLGTRYVENAVEGSREVVRALQDMGKDVWIVSGGLREALLPLAGWLGITPERVQAVSIRFDGEEYAGFDEESPLVHAGGKREACGSLLDGRRGVIVGDGSTDAEAAPPCALFVGFGGVVERPDVRRRAGAWVEGPGLQGVLSCVLTKEERREQEGD